MVSGKAVLPVKKSAQGKQLIVNEPNPSLKTVSRLVVVQFRKTYHGGTETRRNGKELKATVAAEEPGNE
jgi:hypothetical protein